MVKLLMSTPIIKVSVVCGNLPAACLVKLQILCFAFLKACLCSCSQKYFTCNIWVIVHTCVLTLVCGIIVGKFGNTCETLSKSCFVLIPALQGVGLVILGICSNSSSMILSWKSCVDFSFLSLDFCTVSNRANSSLFAFLSSLSCMNTASIVGIQGTLNYHINLAKETVSLLSSFFI